MSTSTIRYEFRLTGRLSERGRQAIRGLGPTRVLTLSQETVVVSDLADPAQLPTVLVLLEDNGVRVSSMRQVFRLR